MEGKDLNLIPPLATLAAGIVIGYLGQRSGMCLVSGIRNLYVVRDLYLFKALPALLAGAFGGFLVFGSIGGDTSGFLLLGQTPGLDSPSQLLVVILGGVGLGFFSVLAQGCPFRQHVLAFSGRTSAITYLAGFYVGIPYFYLVVLEPLDLLLSLIG